MEQQLITIPLVAIKPKSGTPLVLAQAMVGSAPLDPNTVEAQVPQTQYPHIQTEYRAQIYIGTPAKLFNILLDTGSYDLWVFGRGCDCGAIQHSYHVNASSTGENLNVRAPSVTYADGSKYTGFRVKDTVRMGPLAVSAFQFTQVETFSSPWNPDNSSDADGIMGMGFHPTGTTSIVPSFAEELISRKILKKGVFSYFIAANELTGQVSLGGYNTTQFQNASSAPTWIPYLQDDTLATGKISLPLVTASVDNLIVDYFSNHTSQKDGAIEGNTGSAILDTGTSQGIVSYALVDAIAKAMNETTGNGEVFKIYYDPADTSQYTYAVPCSTKRELGGPIVTLSFAGGLTLPITALEYVSQPQPNGPNDIFCQIMLRAVKDGYSGGTYLLGNTFLKRYVTIFDYEDKRVGFALGSGRGSSYSVGVNGSSSAGGVSYVPSKVYAPSRDAVDVWVVVVVAVCASIAIALTVVVAVLYYRGRICGGGRKWDRKGKVSPLSHLASIKNESLEEEESLESVYVSKVLEEEKAAEASSIREQDDQIIQEKAKQSLPHKKSVEVGLIEDSVSESNTKQNPIDSS